MKKEQENVPLATEIIGDLQDVIGTVLEEIKCYSLDLESANFVLNELLKMTDKEPKSKEEALRFVQNQDRIYKYADIARDYVTRVSGSLHDLKIIIQRKESEYEEVEGEEDD